MVKLVIVGGGGFVDGSFLPFSPIKKIDGLITKNPIKSYGLAKTYGLNLYGSLNEIKDKSSTSVYICSTNWTHFNYIKQALKLNFKKIICEKPILTNLDDLREFKKISSLVYGAMIKRAHSFFEKNKLKNKITMRVYADAETSLDHLDPRRGDLLFIELIHFVDLAILFCENNFVLVVVGNRLVGNIILKNEDKEVIIDYNFSSKKSLNDLPFEPDLIKTFWNDSNKVIVLGDESILLYETLFKIKNLMTGN